jgi:hypothetical protein
MIVCNLLVIIFRLPLGARGGGVNLIVTTKKIVNLTWMPNKLYVELKLLKDFIPKENMGSAEVLNLLQ